MPRASITFDPSGQVVTKRFGTEEDAVLAAAGLGALLHANRGNSAPGLTFTGKTLRPGPHTTILNSGLGIYDAATVKEGVPMPNIREWKVPTESGKMVVPRFVVVLPVYTGIMEVLSKRMLPCTKLELEGDATARVLLWLNAVAKQLAKHNVHMTDLKADNIIVDSKGQPYLIDWDLVVYYDPVGDHSRAEPRSCTSFFNYVALLMNDPDSAEAFFNIMNEDEPDDDGSEWSSEGKLYNVFKLVYYAGLHSVIDQDPCAKAYLPLEGLTLANIAMYGSQCIRRVI